MVSDCSRWIPPRHTGIPSPVRVFAKVFRGKFLDGLRLRFDRGEFGSIDSLPALLHTLREQPAEGYAITPFAGPESVLAISNRRILRVEAAW